MVKVRINKLSLSYFKGEKERVIELNSSNADILGKNGAGKTTLATAHFWLWDDKDYNLSANPSVFPLGVEECKPRVEEEIVLTGVDGEEKILTVAKIQTRKVGKPDINGVSKVSYSNTFEINSVPKTERDFIAYFEALGVSLDNMLELSHPDMFVKDFSDKKSREHMRKVLFSMVKDRTDLEIAKLCGEETSDVAKLLENYTLEEIEAMNNATISKIKSEYGKDGEILNAQIEGMEQSKVDIDVSVLELEKNSIFDRLKEIKAEKDLILTDLTEKNFLMDEISKIVQKQSELREVEHSKVLKAKQELVDKQYSLKGQIKMAEMEISACESSDNNYKRMSEDGEKEIADLKTQYKTLSASEFDENSAICPTCGRKFDETKISEIKGRFENHKAEELNKIAEKGKALREKLNNLKAENEARKSGIAEKSENIKAWNDEIQELENQIKSIPETDMTTNAEWLALEQERVGMVDKMEHLAKPDTSKLDFEQNELNNKLVEVSNQIALFNNNATIDEKIQELRAKQTVYEQNKANAEKILFQVSKVKEKKNLILVDDVNSHFKLVKWQLFDFLKNGTYKEVCIPTIDGKLFGTSTNTGKEILAKLDIINGLQEFYGIEFPVFLDGAESLSVDSRERIDIPAQIIYLIVANDMELSLRFIPEDIDLIVEERK